MTVILFSGDGEDDSWKNMKQKISDTVLLTSMEIETEEHTGQVNFALHNKITLYISLEQFFVYAE